MSSLVEPVSTAALISEVEPTLRMHRDTSEAQRRLAPEIASAMLDAGIFQSLVPKAYGGLELEPIEALRLFEEISRIDGSAGWLAANQSGISTLASLLPLEAADEILGGEKTLFAGALFPPGMAAPVEGGYQVTGRWPFASGCDYANWVVGSTVIIDGQAPRTGPHGEPLLMVVAFPAAEARIVDTWNTLGMRGTGSSDVCVEGIFVPERRTWVVAPGEKPGAAFTAPIYLLGFWPVAAVNASVAVGIARAALDDFMALASKTPAYVTTAVGDRSTVQDRLARARGALDAARAYLYATTEDATDDVRGGNLVDAQLGLALSLAGVHAMETACHVVDAVHSMAGSSAIRNEMRFQQYFRDIHTLTQHAYSSTSRFESIGKLMLGKETDWVFFGI